MARSICASPSVLLKAPPVRQATSGTTRPQRYRSAMSARGTHSPEQNKRCAACGGRLYTPRSGLVLCAQLPDEENMCEACAMASGLLEYMHPGMFERNPSRMPHRGTRRVCMGLTAEPVAYRYADARGVPPVFPRVFCWRAHVLEAGLQRAVHLPEGVVVLLPQGPEGACLSCGAADGSGVKNHRVVTA